MRYCITIGLSNPLDSTGLRRNGDLALWGPPYFIRADRRNNCSRICGP